MSDALCRLCCCFCCRCLCLCLSCLSFPQGICFGGCLGFCFSGLSFRAQQVNLLSPVLCQCRHKHYRSTQNVRHSVLAICFPGSTNENGRQQVHSLRSE